MRDIWKSYDFEIYFKKNVMYDFEICMILKYYNRYLLELKKNENENEN